jgi:hypothetical protein
MFTTADLPANFRADFTDPTTLRAVRRSGLRLDLDRCGHGRTDCAACVVAAARRLIETTGDTAPTA